MTRRDTAGAIVYVAHSSRHEEAQVRDKRIRVMRVIARMNVGGPALQIAQLMRGLDPELFDQRLFSGFVGPGEADYVHLRAPDVETHRIPVLGRSVRPTDDLRALALLTAAMRDFRPHIVHTHTAKAGTLGRLAALLARVPVRVHTFHGHLLHGYFPPATTRLVVTAERTLARLSERLVAVGDRVRDDLVAAGVGRLSQYVVVPPGTALGTLPGRVVARDKLGLPATAPVVAYVGRLTRVKRPDRLLDVARAVHRAVPDVRFLICGDGDLRGHTLGADLAGCVRLLGWRADVETVYAAADMVLLTSDNEGAPVSLIEAGLAGRPAVAPRVGGVPDVVRDEVTGLLAAPDAAALADRTVRLLCDEEMRLRMGERARQWTTERFGAARLVADTHELYARIAVDKGWWQASMLQAIPRPPLPARPPRQRLDREEVG
jgi:glycosyltransferase involved in cell wall biosynthesis